MSTDNLNRNGIIGHAEAPDGPGPHIMAADTLTGVVEPVTTHVHELAV